MKKKKSPVGVVLVLALLVAVAGAVTFVVTRFTETKEVMDGSRYFNLSEENDIGLVVDQTVSDVPAKVIDGKIYLPYETTADEINGSFFVSGDKTTLIVTTPTDKHMLSVSETSADARSIDGGVYIALDLVREYTDMDCEEYTEPQRLVISTAREYNQIRATKDKAAIRYQAGIKSPVLRMTIDGESLRLVDEEDTEVDGWAHVITSDGYRGYISEEAVDGKSEPVTITRDDRGLVYTHKLLDKKINMAFHQTTSHAANNVLAESLTDVTGINVIAPTWFFLDSEDGDMTEISNKSYVETAHGAGLLVWGVLNDFDGQVNSSESTLAALSSEAAREKMIRTSVDAILDVNADGICLDIEKISDECAPYFLEFVREMSAECRKNDLYLSVCDYVPRYTKSLNRKEQARVCDYVICMCYDEHINGSEEAGSVASLPFVESGIRDTLLEVPAEQTVIAIPFFTRLWKTVSPGIPTASAMGMLEAEKWIRSNNLSTEWDDVCAQEYVEMNSGNTRYQMWLENNASLEEKLKLICAADCAGVAEWKLGLEKADVWDLIAEYIVD